MFIVKQVKLLKYVMLKRPLLKVIIPLSLAGGLLPRPWQKSNLFDALYDECSWLPLTIGLLANFLILCYVSSDYYGNIGAIIHIGIRSECVVHLFSFITITAYIYSFYYVVMISTIVGWSRADITFQGMSAKEFPVSGEIDILWVFFRTIVVIGLFLLICGLIFYIVFFFFRKSGLAASLTLFIPALEEIGQVLWGKQVLLSLVFPPETLFYFENSSFFRGCMVLLSIVVGLLILLLIRFHKLDWL